MFKKLLVLAVTAGLYAGNTLSETSAGELPDNVLLKYENIEITTEDLRNHFLYVLPEGVYQSKMRDPSWVRKQIADLYQRRLLVREAEEKGFDKDQTFIHRLEHQRDIILMDMVFNDAIENAAEPDFELIARENFDSNREKYTKPETVEASHILILITEEQDEATAREKAEAALAELRKPDADFAAVAVQFSEDPSVVNNKGFLGEFSATQMVAPFSQAVFAMQEPGEISELVKTQFGYHIIKLHRKIPTGQLAFEDVRSRLIQEAQESFGAQVKIEKMSELRSAEGILINQKAIGEFSISNE